MKPTKLAITVSMLCMTSASFVVSMHAYWKALRVNPIRPVYQNPLCYNIALMAFRCFAHTPQKQPSFSHTRTDALSMVLSVHDFAQSLRPNTDVFLMLMSNRLYGLTAGSGKHYLERSDACAISTLAPNIRLAC